MKVNCPNCSKPLQAPDDWGGKMVKCPGCKKAIKLPVTKVDVDGPSFELDVSTLSNMESAGETKAREQKKKLSLKEAQALAAQAEQTPTEESGQDPLIRTCPSCGEKVRSPDLYSEIMCKHCGAGIPGRSLEGADKARYHSDADRAGHYVTFYAGFTGAVMYPLPALGSIAAAMGIALASIAVPLLAVLGFIMSAGLNPVNESAGETDYGWVGVFITIAFIVQGIYFGSVAYCILIDTIRSTTSGTEHPPDVSWNIVSLGAALVGYAALVFLYLAVTLGLVYFANGTFPMSLEDLAALTQPFNLAVLAIITLGVPMNMIGLSSTQALDGLNPARVAISIANTVGHYIFLFLISVLFLGIYAAIMSAVLGWAGPKILTTAKEGLGAGFVNMLMGLVAWAVVIGVGFYFAYSLGRILGLFTRTYRKQLKFEL